MKCMKRSLRLLALMGAALLLVTLTTACGGGGDDKNLDYILTVVDFQTSRWQRSAEDTSPHYKIWNSILDDLKKEYNVGIDFQHVGPSEIVQQMKLAVFAGDPYADVIVDTQWAGGQAIAADILADLNTVPCKWDSPWWNQTLRNYATIGNKTYLANGSFIFDAAMTWSIYYNAEIWNEVMPGVDPYELVRNNEWTLDKFREICNKAKRQESTGSATFTDDDRWGAVTPGGDYRNAMFLSMGGHFFNSDNGTITLACNNEKTRNIVDKLQPLATDNGAVNGTHGDWPTIQQFFLDGKALFLVNMPGVSAIKDMKADFGMLPMPKFDKDSPWLSGVDHNASVMMMTNTNENLETVARILDIIGEKGLALETAYWPDFETAYWRDATWEDDQDMLDNYIAHHGQYDMGILLENVADCFNAPKSIVYASAFGPSMDFASRMEGQASAIQTEINDLMEQNQ